MNRTRFVRNLPVAGCAVLLALAIATAPAAASKIIEARVDTGMGPTESNPNVLAPFFDGFVAGSTSWTNSLSFDDGNVQMTVNLTIAGFDSIGTPAALTPNVQSVGIGADTFISPGEVLKVTFNDVSFSQIGMLGFDPLSTSTLLGSIRFVQPDNSVFGYTYAGPGTPTGDDTVLTVFDPPQLIAAGDMFTITGDSGVFRMRFISIRGCYEVPEPAAASLAGLGLASIAWRRRRR